MPRRLSDLKREGGGRLGWTESQYVKFIFPEIQNRWHGSNWGMTAHHEIIMSPGFLMPKSGLIYMWWTLFSQVWPHISVLDPVVDPVLPSMASSTPWWTPWWTHIQGFNPGLELNGTLKRGQVKFCSQLLGQGWAHFPLKKMLKTYLLGKKAYRKPHVIQTSQWYENTTIGPWTFLLFFIVRINLNFTAHKCLYKYPVPSTPTTPPQKKDSHK